MSQADWFIQLRHSSRKNSLSLSFLPFSFVRTGQTVDLHGKVLLCETACAIWSRSGYWAGSSSKDGHQMKFLTCQYVISSGGLRFYLPKRQRSLIRDFEFSGKRWRITESLDDIINTSQREHYIWGVNHPLQMGIHLYHVNYQLWITWSTLDC